MRKKSNMLVILAIAIVLAFSAYCFSGDNEVIDDDGLCTVTIVNVTPEAGSLVLSVKEGDTYTDMTSTVIDVEPGTKVKAYLKDGLNEGHEIYAWGIDTDGFMAFVKGESENEDGLNYYTEEKFVKTIQNDMTIYLYTTTGNEHLVSFYDSSVVSKRTPIGLAFVEDGKNASTAGVIEQKKIGFDQLGWSESIHNVTEDLEVYPTFESNIFTMFRDYRSMFMHGLLVTLILSVVSVSLAMVLGVILCLIRMSNSKVLSAIVTAYVEVIRGIPLLLQLLLVYTLIGPTRIALGSFFTTEVLSCIITLTINSSAYSSEIFRSGIQAVDAGQMEAGRALGMSKWMVMKKIIIPQGLRNALPSIVNELIAMIKETSLAVSVDASIGELMCVRKNITAATFINLPPYIIVAIIYFCVTFSLSKFVGLIEKRLAERD